MSAFDQAFAIVIGHEGGYVNDPRDPGGETKFGISKRSHPHVDVAGLTLDAAKVIYRAEYWDAVRGDDLPPPLALVVFDAAVNSGPGTSAKWLQAAVGATADGIIGPATLRAVAGRQGQGVELLVELLAGRLLFMASLPGWRVFRRGWTRRVIRLAFQAVRMGL